MRSCPFRTILLSTMLLCPIARAAPPALSADRAAEVAITESALRAEVRFLSDDRMGGRGPGSPGEDLARTYVAAQMEGLGLLPGGDRIDGKPGYFQWLQLVGLRSHLVAPPELRGTASTVPVAIRIPPSDMVLVTGEQTASSQVQDAEIVFVGYGITAPEYKWDDYKGADLRGKILLMMNNDPESDDKLFAGKTRLYYGRWDYKYMEAARHGAAGAIIIHTTPSAGYPWSVVRSSWDDENFEAPEQVQDRTPRLKVRGWLTEDASRRVAQAGGQDLDALRRAAERRDFRPVPLSVLITARIQTEIRRLKSANVLGLLPGTDAKLKQETVVVSAHLDHLGTRNGRNGKQIYNGALDNASGVAALLSLARAATMGTAHRRTLLFAAFTGEEAGLIGSEFFVKHVPSSDGRPIADINIDGINVFGRSPQVVQVGRGKSSLDAVVDAVAATQGRKVLPDQMPEKGSFYRSDQLNFARVGIPSIYLGMPSDLLSPAGKVLAGAGRARVERYIQENYHQPSDKLRDDWDLTGAVQDVRLLYLCTLRVADAPAGFHPAFHPGDEFGRK